MVHVDVDAQNSYGFSSAGVWKQQQFRVAYVQSVYLHIELIDSLLLPILAGTSSSASLFAKLIFSIFSDSIKCVVFFFYFSHSIPISQLQIPHRVLGTCQIWYDDLTFVLVKKIFIK